MSALKKILDDVDEVDLTPMIDVTFLLLIYFMVTTMLKQPEAELSIQLPGKPQSSDVTPMDMLKVRIGDEGEVYLNGSEIEDGFDFKMPDLVANLKTQKGMRDQLISSGAKSKEEAELKEIRTNVHREANFFFVYANPDGYAAFDGGKEGGYLIRGIYRTYKKKEITTKYLNDIVSQIAVKVKEMAGKQSMQDVQHVSNVHYKIQD